MKVQFFPSNPSNLTAELEAGSYSVAFLKERFAIYPDYELSVLRNGQITVFDKDTDTVDIHDGDVFSGAPKRGYSN